MEKLCPYCKEIFGCNHIDTDVCGCEQTEVVVEIKQFIKDTYVCLCGNCIERVIDSFYIYGVNPQYRKVKRVSTADF